MARKFLMKESWKALRLPAWMVGKAGRGRIRSEDDLHLLEIKLPWKKYFSYGVMLIPTKFLSSCRRLQINCLMSHVNMGRT